MTETNPAVEAAKDAAIEKAWQEETGGRISLGHATFRSMHDRAVTRGFDAGVRHANAAALAAPVTGEAADEQRAIVENMIRDELHFAVQYDQSANRRLYHQDRADALRTLIAAVSGDEWVSAEDRLPSEDGNYLCSCAWLGTRDECGAAVWQFYWSVGEKEWSDCDRESEDVNNYWEVRAWMPLPEPYTPPERKEEK